MNWITSLQQAVAYIENNLTAEISVDDVADHVFSSSAHFQRMFHMVTGYTIGGYIRNRRLTLAGQDLLQNEKLGDIVLRYQYVTQESFSKAFLRFHGVSPSKATRENIKWFHPLTITVNIQGGFEMSHETNVIPTIVKTYKQATPAMRFIGKKYGDEDRVNGLFGVKWGEWFENGWFDVLDKLGSPEGMDNAIGLCGHENGVFKYWIGKFTTAGSPVPEGFDYIDYEPGHVGICCIKGPEDGIYCNEPMCCDRLKAEGFNVLDKDFYCFERYICPDTEGISDLEDGHMLLDICFFVA